MAQRTNKKPANTKTKRTQAAKKNTQTKTRAAARKPRDQEVHKILQEARNALGLKQKISSVIYCIFYYLHFPFFWDVWYVSKEKALGHGCIMRF